MDGEARVFVTDGDSRSEVSRLADEYEGSTAGYQGCDYAGDMTHLFFFRATPELVEHLTSSLEWEELRFRR